MQRSFFWGICPWWVPESLTPFCKDKNNPRVNRGPGFCRQARQSGPPCVVLFSDGPGAGRTYRRPSDPAARENLIETVDIEHHGIHLDVDTWKDDKRTFKPLNHE